MQKMLGDRPAWAVRVSPRQTTIRKGRNMKKPSMKSLLLTAAMTGLLTGTAAISSASTQSTSNNNNPAARSNATSRVLMAQNFGDDKHACKGQNSCKGKGGCKSGDNGCKGKNSCKGKGGCATDGSNPHAFV